MINVTVIGFGGVGSALSLLLLNNEHNLKLTVLEPDPNKEGAILDLSHGNAQYTWRIATFNVKAKHPINEGNF